VRALFGTDFRMADPTPAADATPAAAAGIAATVFQWAVRDFLSIATGANPTLALYFLQRHNWSVKEALEEYFESSTGEGAVRGAHEPEASECAPSLPSASSSVEDENDEDEEPVPLEAARAAAQAQPRVAPAPLSVDCASSDKELHMRVVAARPMQLAHFPEYSKAITDRVKALCDEKAALIKQVTGELVDQFVSPMSPYLQFTPLTDSKHIGFSWKNGDNKWDNRWVNTSVPGSAKPFIDTIKTAIIRYLPTPEQLKELASDTRLSDFPEDPAIVAQRQNVDECIRRVQCTTHQLVDVLDVDPDKPLKPILEELRKAYGLHCVGGLSAVGMAESPPGSPRATPSSSSPGVESPQ